MTKRKEVHILKSANSQELQKEVNSALKGVRESNPKIESSEVQYRPVSVKNGCIFTAMITYTYKE